MNKISILMMVIICIPFSYALTSLQIGIPNASLDNFVPYTGALYNVDLNGNNLSAANIYANVNYSYIQNVPSFITGLQVPGFEEDPLFVTDEPLLVYQSNCASGFVVQNLTGGGGASQCIPVGSGGGNISGTGNFTYIPFFNGHNSLFTTNMTYTNGILTIGNSSLYSGLLPLVNESGLLQVIQSSTRSVLMQSTSYGIKARADSPSSFPIFVLENRGQTVTANRGMAISFNLAPNNGSDEAINAGSIQILKVDNWSNDVQQDAQMIFTVRNDQALSEPLVIVNNSLGVRTRNPAAPIHAIYTTGTGMINQLHETSTSGAQMVVRKARGSVASPLNVSVGDLLFRLLGEAYSNNSFRQSASIDFSIQGNPSTGDVSPAAGIIFRVNQGTSSVASQRASLNANGSFAIGASLNAQALLHQDGGTATTSYHKFTVGTTTGQTSTDGTDVGITSLGNFEIRNREATNITIFTNNTAAISIFDNRTVLINNLSGIGNAFVCVNANGLLYRSNVSCV